MNSLRIKLNDHLDLEKTLNCGQTFRWNRVDEATETYEGCISGHGVRVRLDGDVLNIEGDGLKSESFYRKYFSLDVPYDEICDRLSQLDMVMEHAVADGRGIFLLQQEPWEMIVTFILSANNNIPRITKSIALLCEAYGEGSFPSPAIIAALSSDELRCLGFGYRDKYVISTAKRIVDEDIDLLSWYGIRTEELRGLLMGFPGVGRKVADCILLFGYGRHEVFPIDTWIRKAMLKYYPGKTDGTTDDIIQFVSTYFGSEAGFAQQLLFYHIRRQDGR